MSDDISMRLDPKDVPEVVKRIENNTIPCNIYGLIADILDRLEALEK